MKQIIKALFLCTVAALLTSFYMSTKAQQPEKVPTVEEMAAKEADRLATVLNLEPWQVFYVDSTLQHDYAVLKSEMDRLKKERVTTASVYQTIQDKWTQQIDDTYKTIFNEKQWNAYLKMGGAKAQKERDKRNDIATNAGKKKK